MRKQEGCRERDQFVSYLFDSKIIRAITTIFKKFKLLSLFNFFLLAHFCFANNFSYNDKHFFLYLASNTTISGVSCYSAYTTIFSLNHMLLRWDSGKYPSYSKREYFVCKTLCTARQRSLTRFHWYKTQSSNGNNRHKRERKYHLLLFWESKESIMFFYTRAKRKSACS